MGDSLATIIATLQRGQFVAVSDHEDREDEADLVVAAEHVTTEQMAFLIRYTSGIITVPMLPTRAEELKLELLRTDNPANFDTPFMMPVDLKSGTRGGVSAAERVATVRALVDPTTSPEELGRPGHVFPLRAKAGGLAARQGHTEASIHLMQQAGLQPIAVIGELMNDDGTMMRGELLQAFLSQHEIPLISIAALLES